MRSFISAAIAATCAYFAMAGDAQAETALQMQYRHSYVVPKGVMLHDGPVMQWGLTLDIAKPCYGGAWWSTSLDEWEINSDRGDELNYFLGCTGPVGPLAIDAGFVYLDFIGLADFGGIDTAFVFADVGVPFKALDGALTLAPYVRAEYRHTVEKTEPSSNGYYLFGGLKTKYRLSGTVLGLVNRTALLYDSGTFGALDEGLLGNVFVGADLHVRDWLTFNAANAFVTFPVSDLDDAREPEVSAGTGMTILF